MHPARDVQLCIDLKVDFLGFVFYDKSPRNLDLEDVKQLKYYKKQMSSFVSVTVNPSNEFIKNIALDKGLFHYIDFMQDIHESLTKLSGKKNPLDEIAKSLNRKYKIIFIDEFQV